MSSSQAWDVQAYCYQYISLILDLFSECNINVSHAVHPKLVISKECSGRLIDLVFGSHERLAGRSSAPYGIREQGVHATPLHDFTE